MSELCRACGQPIPAAKLLELLPGESQAEYAARMRREWKRETQRPRRRHSSVSEAQEEQEIYAVLGVR